MKMAKIYIKIQENKKPRLLSIEEIIWKGYYKWINTRYYVILIFNIGIGNLIKI